MQSEQAETKMTPVTFILAGCRLVTVRYAEPRAFAIYAARCNRAEPDLRSGVNVADRLDRDHRGPPANFIERIQADVDVVVAYGVEHQRRLPPRASVASTWCKVDRREGEMSSKARELHPPGACSPSSPYPAQERKVGKALQVAHPHRRARRALADRPGGFLSTKIIFLLDATLGMIAFSRPTSSRSSRSPPSCSCRRR